MQTSSPESDQKICKYRSRHTKKSPQNSEQKKRGLQQLTHVFGLDLNATNQLCVIPVIESQAIHWSDAQQETTIDACKHTTIHLHKTIKDLTRLYYMQSRNQACRMTVHMYLLVYFCTQNCEYRAYCTANAMQNSLPSAPKSGLKDFFSLKFLKIFTTLLLSRIAYLNLKQSHVSFHISFSIFSKQLLWHLHLLRWIMSPDKLLCRSKALVPQSHSGVDDVLSVSTHHHKPKQQD